METMGEIETDGLITNPQVPQDNIALQLFLAQSLSELCFCCLQQSFCVFVMQHEAFPYRVLAVPVNEDNSKIFRIRKTAIDFMSIIMLRHRQYLEQFYIIPSKIYILLQM